MIEHRRGDLVESVVGGADDEEVGHNSIYGRGLAEGPCNYRGVVSSQGTCFTGGEGANGAKDGLLEDQRRQLEVQVSGGAFWVGEADQLLGEVGCALDAPCVVLVLFVWVSPDPPEPKPKVLVYPRSDTGRHTRSVR